MTIADIREEAGYKLSDKEIEAYVKTLPDVTCIANIKA